MFFTAHLPTGRACESWCNKWVCKLEECSMCGKEHGCGGFSEADAPPERRCAKWCNDNTCDEAACVECNDGEGCPRPPSPPNSPPSPGPPPLPPIPPPPPCTQPGVGLTCMESRCCEEPSHTCFRKSGKRGSPYGYANCRLTCPTDGTYDCEILAAPPPAPPWLPPGLGPRPPISREGCSGTWKSCWDSLCCASEHDGCFRRVGRQFAMCKPMSTLGCQSDEDWACPGWEIPPPQPPFPPPPPPASPSMPPPSPHPPTSPPSPPSPPPSPTPPPPPPHPQSPTPSAPPPAQMLPSPTAVLAIAVGGSFSGIAMMCFVFIATRLRCFKRPPVSDGSKGLNGTGVQLVSANGVAKIDPTMSTRKANVNASRAKYIRQADDDHDEEGDAVVQSEDDAVESSNHQQVKRKKAKAGGASRGKYTCGSAGTVDDDEILGDEDGPTYSEEAVVTIDCAKKPPLSSVCRSVTGADDARESGGAEPEHPARRHVSHPTGSRSGARISESDDDSDIITAGQIRSGREDCAAAPGQAAAAPPDAARFSPSVSLWTDLEDAVAPNYSAPPRSLDQD